MQRPMIRVAVVDDHPIVREGIVAALDDRENITVCGVAGDAASGAALLERERPDVVVLDLELPGRSGLDAIVDFKARVPQTRIVVFSAFGGEERIAEALARGADSYVLKGTAGEELVATVRSVAAGDARLPADVASQLVRALQAPRGLRVTERERQILRLVAAGQSNKAIAAGLGISERTVKFHVSEILARLGAENRAQAVAIAQQRGLV